MNQDKIYQEVQEHIKKRDFEKALIPLDILLKENPYHPEYISDTAVVLFNLKKTSKALELLNKAINLEPKNPYRYTSRAFVLASIGRTDEAIKDYEKGLELDPEDIIAYNNLGLLQEQKGYLKKSKETFNKGDKIAAEKGIYDLEKRKKNTEQKSSETEPDAITILSLLKYSYKQLTTKEGFRDYLIFVKKSFRRKK